MRILIVKTSSMGDVIHALPAITDIRRHLPDAQINWLVETPFHQIVKLHPAVSNVIAISWRKWRKQLLDAAVRQTIKTTITTLRDAQYDVVIDLQGLIKSAVWVKLTRAEQTHGFNWDSAREPLASIAYLHFHQISKEALAIDRSRMLCAAALGYSLDDTSDFGIRAPAQRASDWRLPAPYVAFVHGSSDDARLWPQSDWVKLAQTVHARGLAVALIWGSEAERVRSEALQKTMQALGVSVFIPPFLTIAQTAQVLGAARAVVGLDTGFTHLAGALNVPCVSIHRTHDPALTGVQGSAACASLGGIGQTPSYQTVAGAFEGILPHDAH
jgi:heptosyltransferase I